ncbi:beta-ketoacyl-[acyl-carrier-protein] synthase family protein [Streptomyces aureocirculatus]|uniref:hypothetical protein n=1 Tax=Streptomyces aureocirculatus TaxID=67275 RepID=UPI00068AD84A|nr:hypothetical protein [Streptomyces aureocirculatus]
MAFVTRPTLVFPPHQIDTTDVVKDINARMPAPPEERLPPAVVQRFATNLQIDTRFFVTPLEAVSETGTVAERNDLALPLMYERAVEAARTAIRAANLTEGDIDCIITSHSTTPATPGLDVLLVNELRLREDVMRMPATQLGCVAGAHTLSWAAQLVDRMPNLRVLVVIGEALSTVYRSEQNDAPGVIYRTLFGDSAGACVVSSDPQRAVLETRSTWQRVVPGTMNAYRLQYEPGGLKFTSEKGAPDGVTHLMEPLWAWLRSDDPDWTPEVVVAHPGSPSILESTAKGLGCPPEFLRHSLESLRTRGNLGGAAVLDILARTADSRPPHGSRTLMLSIGPGLTGAAIEGRWHNPCR